MKKRPPRGANRLASRPRVRLFLGLESLEDRRVPAAIAVTSALDSGPGTLRQALIDAASPAFPGRDQITFASGLGPILLTSGALTIDSPVTITGAASRTSVRRDADAGSFAVFAVSAGVEATLENLEIAGGSKSGVSNAGTLTIRTSLVRDNSGDYGGGIDQRSAAGATSLVVVGSTFTNNKAAYYGGAIFVSSGGSGSPSNLTVSDSVFDGNSASYGGAVASGAGGGGVGDFSIANSSFTNNRAVNYGGAVYALASGAGSSLKLAVSDSSFANDTGYHGGAIYLRGGVDVSIANSDFGGNSAYLGGAVFADSVPAGSSLKLAVSDSDFTGNGYTDGNGRGGAVFLAYGVTGEVSISSSSFTDNFASDGGAVYADSVPAGASLKLAVSGSDFSGNSAGGSGGAVYLSADGGAVECAITDSSFANNVAQYNGGAITVWAVRAGSSLKLTVSGSDFSANSGGGVFLSAEYGAAGDCSVSRCSFTDNSGGAGGAVSVSVGDANSSMKVAVSDSEFSGNSAVYGGAVDLSMRRGATGDFSISRCSFTNNSADGGGGAVLIEGDVDYGGVTTARLTISDSEFSGNSAVYGGGAISLAPGMADDCSIRNSVFTNNSASGGHGGAVAVQMTDASNGSIGRLAVSESSFSGNSAGGSGGAVYSLIVGVGRLSVADSDFGGNSAGGSGGAIQLGALIGGAVYSISGSDFGGNSAGGSGGAIQLKPMSGGLDCSISDADIHGNSADVGGGLANSSSSLVLERSTIRGNTARVGGGISNGGEIVVRSSTIDGNSATEEGGGLLNTSNQRAVSASIFSSTIAGNSAGGWGGGLLNMSKDYAASASIFSSTVAGNSAGTWGGNVGNIGYGNGPQARFVAYGSTIAGGSAAADGGGGVFNAGARGAVSAELQSTIVAGSTGGDLRGGGAFSGSHNLIQDGSGTGLTGTISGDPRLAPLADNGGPTRTMALLPGSPAINAGSVAAYAPDFDQRGAGFPRVLQGAADVGAYESPLVSAAYLAGLGSTTADGAYGRGATILVSARFSMPVTVAGSPQLLLNTGAWASYVSGSGSDVLTFSYVVAPGESTPRLDAASAAALDLNGGSIVNAQGNPSLLAVPVGAAAGSLASNANVVVDAVAPVVVSYRVLFGAVGSYELIGSSRRYLPWTVTGIQVVFDKPVTATTASLSGISASSSSSSGNGTVWTWRFAGLSQTDRQTALAGSGAAAVADALGNPLGDGAGFSQRLRVLYGDYNDDGVVSSLDMVGVRNASLAGAYDVFADLNGDGRVDNADVLIARNRNGARIV